MEILLGSTNAGKFIDLKEALSDLDVTLLRPQDVGITESPREEGDTFRANALQKARFYFERSTLRTLADDSGILVEALTNELGIHTRRWGAGPEASDEEWVAFFLERMKNETSKRARFVCCLCFIDEQGSEHFFEGSAEGVITDELQASYNPGLPIAACFKPDGSDRVYAAMEIEEKNTFSHRGKAVRLLHDFLQRRS